ncbi:MAG TPA: sugar phosphate isomerase/epimerase [Gaiellaceae bacterium]
MRVGMLGRFFPLNWRPPADEIRFAAEHGFAAIQIRSDRAGEIADELRADHRVVGLTFAAAGVEPVLEMLVFHPGEPGTIPRALRANLPAIEQIGFRRVHVHPVGPDDAAPLLADDFGEALEIARVAGLTLGVEHSAVGHRLLIDPASVHALLDAVPGLHFVWDLNHTRAEDVPEFARLRDRLSLVHVSDTPLPETNHHLPLGRGSVDFSVVKNLDVPLILEVGGLPISGGPGLDTDDVLLDSLTKLRAV